ncbi:hypothetical protein LSCM1_01904 [Leishmania martiniquensis]|uniref:Uncharacterized protein n=1 Tax=Leishmania martiniquensis TaxID=1580590 RepID=A0A836GVM9_9TRYP|nr:hypothetical protein LSCM1_01904 [Leishmania martiniquensis]
MLPHSCYPNSAAGAPSHTQQPMVCPNGVAYVPAGHPAAHVHAAHDCFGVGAVSSIPFQHLSPAAVRAVSPKMAAAGHLGTAYAGSCTALRPSAGFYPPYAALRQYAPQQPQVTGVMPGQVPPSPQRQSIAFGTAAPACVTPRRSASTSGPSCGLQSSSVCVSPPERRREGRRSARHRHGEAAETPKSVAQLPSSSRHGGRGGQRERSHHRDDTPANGARSARAPSSSTTAKFWEGLPCPPSGPNMQSLPVSPVAAGGATPRESRDGGGRRRRLRRATGRSERRRDASPRSQSDQQIHLGMKEPHRRRRHCRGHRDSARRNVNQSESASPRSAADLADISRHERSSNRYSSHWDSPTNIAAGNTSTAVGVAVSSRGPKDATNVGTPALHLATAGSTMMVAAPQPQEIIPDVLSAHRVASNSSPVSVVAVAPSSAIQPAATLKDRRHHRRYRDRRRARQASLTRSDGSSDAASSRSSSSYSSPSSSSGSASVSRSASASSRDHRRRRCRDRQERRGGQRLPHSSSPPLDFRRMPGDHTGGAPASPVNDSASVAPVSKKRGGGGGILKFFRRSKSAVAVADPMAVGNAGASGGKAAVMVPFMVPQKVLYSTPIGLYDTFVPSRVVMTGQQQRKVSSRSKSLLQCPGDHWQGHSQHPVSAGGAMVWRAPPQQGGGSNIPSGDPRCAVVPPAKSKGLFGGLFRKKNVTTDLSTAAVTSVEATDARQVSGWVSPSTYPSVSGTPQNFTMNAASGIGCATPPAPLHPTPPGGAHAAAFLDGTTATNLAFVPKSGIFGRFTKKGKAAVAQQQWLQLLQQMEAQRQLQLQKQIGDQQSCGDRGRHRRESHDQASAVDQRGGRESRQRTSGNRNGNAGGRGRSRHYAPPPTAS